MQEIFPNPCKYVKDSCNKIYKNSKNVKINENKINFFSQQIIEGKTKLNFPNWCDSHFKPETVDFEYFLRYIFVIDTLNYCFWPNFPFEYYDLSKNLYEILKNNIKFFEIDFLKNIQAKDLKENLFKCDFCLLEERARMLREVFNVISLYFNNSCREFIKKCNKNAVQLVKNIIDNFCCFRDQAIYNGEQVFFYKRAQILVSDLYIAYKDLIKVTGKNEINEVLDFGTSINNLTMFADYRVPQILREMEILEYSKQLSEKIDNKVELLHGSIEEIEIRAATIISVEKIKNKLIEAGMKNVLSIEIDIYLWENGEKIKDKAKPHHRTLSIFY